MASTNTNRAWMDVEGKRTFTSQYIKDEKGRLPRDNALIRERWVRWFQNFLTPSFRPLIRALWTSLSSGPSEDRWTMPRQGTKWQRRSARWRAKMW